MTTRDWLLRLLVATACMVAADALSGRADRQLRLFYSSRPTSPAPGPQESSPPFPFAPDPSFSSSPSQSSPLDSARVPPSSSDSPSVVEALAPDAAGDSAFLPRTPLAFPSPGPSPDAFEIISPALQPVPGAPPPLKALPPSAGGHRRREYHGVFNVDDFGAVGNGIANDTQAFISTWQRACRHRKNRNPMMLVPGGKTYLVYPVAFKGPCQNNFSVQIRGTIVAPESRDRWKGFDTQTWILIKKVANFRLFGPGTIDGQGQQWWSHSCKRNRNEPCRRAPTALTFRHSQHIEVEGLTITNSQQMHLDLSACSDVEVRSVTVSSPEESPNTDGIHLEKSQTVLITQTTISTGDDCISIGPGTTHVLIQDINCGPGHGISIGSLGKKRQSFDRVAHVRVQNAFLRDTLNGLRIKTWEGGQGWAHDFAFQHVVMENVKNPILIDQFYCDDEHSGTCEPKKATTGSKQGLLVSNVLYSDIRGSSASQVAVTFRCNPTNPCHMITLEDVALQYKDKQASSVCQNAFGSTERNVLPPTCLQSESKYRESNWNKRNRSRHT